MLPEERIRDHLAFLYGQEAANEYWPRFRQILEDFTPPAQPEQAGRGSLLSEQDAILITYADQFQAPNEKPLQTLARFMEARLSQAFSAVHILPFFPYSSDDGFSVIDYRQVDPDFGSWQDIAQLGKNFRLMFDAVINHISRQSDWFRAFLRQESPFRDYFIRVEPGVDLSMVVRPRARPLLTGVKTTAGGQFVWTTFSEDQIDLNFSNPDVLAEITGLLLFYVEKGADIIRLDAIAYLWKEPGTASIHLPQTHAVIKLWRAALDAVAPWVILITETNVPHEENISYFGRPVDGGVRTDEAQMVYQFPLAPLVLHTFLSGESRTLSRWVEELKTPPGGVFFNFIASHDGIGVRPAEGILPPGQIRALVDRTLAHGGEVSYKTDQDGSQSVYELNITLYDWLNNPADPEPETDIPRFLASQVIMLSLAGVPGVYVHSLFGSRNCRDCVDQTGRARSINRAKFQLEQVEAWLTDSSARQRSIFQEYIRVLQTRSRRPAFHPAGEQKVLDLDPSVFALIRRAPGGSEEALCLVNVTAREVTLAIRPAEIGLQPAQTWNDLISGQIFSGESDLLVTMGPYRSIWLIRRSETRSKN